ncbi:unnamed protein product [Caenorhabditis angaria]|uniref:Uncharacterized protein n=1 Tax=Caenorhabditis angaria TaxID=860376 RepID=A0A9P1MUT0_9PELO|nr:unnamed protein product [Caenorhabditis angaria]
MDKEELLIRVSSSDEGNTEKHGFGDINKGFAAELDWWKTGGQQMNLSPKPTILAKKPEEDDDFPEEARWWPKNDNSEWNLGEIQVRKDTTESKRLEYAAENYEDDTSSEEEEEDDDENDEEPEKYVQLSFSRRQVFRDDPTNRFLGLNLGKTVKMKTYIMEKNVKPRFFIDCNPQQYETASGILFNNDQEKDENNNCCDRGKDKWIFYKETSRCVNPLPPRKYKTYSYEINIEHIFHVPTKAVRQIEFVFGTIKDTNMMMKPENETINLRD